MVSYEVTGCFKGATLARLAPADTGRYEAASRTDLDRYLRDAGRVRRDAASLARVIGALGVPRELTRIEIHRSEPPLGVVRRLIVEVPRP